MPLSQAKALVTGASSGIGAAVARALLETGAQVALLARRAERLQSLAQPYGERALVLPTDVRDNAAQKAALERALEVFGGLSVVVHNAGLGRNSAILDGTVEDWRTVLETNLLAPMAMAQLALARASNLHLVFISSMSAHRTPKFGGMYAASKAGLRAAVESLRKQLRAAGRADRVTLVSPGWVQTEFMDVSLQDADRARAHWEGMSALQPEDIAQAVLYALRAHPRVDVNDILIRPADQLD